LQPLIHVYIKKWLKTNKTTTTETITFIKWIIGGWAGWQSRSSDENRERELNSFFNTATMRQKLLEN